MNDHKTNIVHVCVVCVCKEEGVGRDTEDG